MAQGFMNSTPSTPGTQEVSGIRLLLLHGACFALVILYVNMFPFWAWLSKALNHGTFARILPILVALSVLLLLAPRFIQRVNRGRRIRFAFLGLGIVAAFLALAIPDPEFPIKRIHVAEYILLSLLVRYTLSRRLGGLQLALFTALVTALYGVHDEMIQGLHSLRYYGWRDMIVNASAGLSGAMLGHGLVCFEELFPDKPAAGRSATASRGILFTALLAAVVWQILYLYHHRGAVIPLAALAPVTVGCAAIAGIHPRLIIASKDNHGLQTVFWQSLALLAYPLLTWLDWIEFL